MYAHHDILNAVKMALVVVDRHFTIEYMNDAAEVFCGGSTEQLRGKKFESVFAGEAVQEAALQRCFNDYEIYTLREIQLSLSLKNERAMVNIAVSPIDEARLLFEIEPLDRMLFISKEEQMRNAQLTSRHLVRGIAHEIKNPLGSIRGAAQLLRGELATKTQTEYTDLIIEEVDRLRTLVDRLLSPNHTPCFEPVNIHEVIERVLRVVANDTESSCEIVRDYDPSLPSMQGDFDQLLQAFLNLVRNAQEATQSCDAPQLVIKTRVENQFTIGAKRYPVVACIHIKDNGVGIPESIKDQIFLPLVTGTASGTGLGLAITHTIVGLHKGLITCASEPGFTEFVLYFPLDLNGDRGTDEL
ncbi:MAG: PAS domain-containing protein [Gammaproteobacteria bacterium]|nr:PAS domain-containing protein [Gammaproteobacteria bacterium]